MSTTSHLSLVSLDFPVKLMRLVYSKCDMILVYAYIILLGLTGKSQRKWGKSQSIFISIIKHNVVSWQDPWFPWYLRFRHLSKGRRHQDVAGLGMGMIWRISFFLYDQMMKQENIWKCTHVLMDFFFFQLCMSHQLYYDDYRFYHCEFFLSVQKWKYPKFNKFQIGNN